MADNIISYAPVKKGGFYNLLIHGLWDWMKGEFRVNLVEEGAYPTTQLFDIKFSQPADRNRLQEYIEEISKQVNLRGIYFSSTGLYGDSYYSWKKFKEIYGDWESIKYWMDKVNIPQLDA